MRLLHEVCRFEGTIDFDGVVPGGPYFRSGEPERERRPLIERPFEVRKKVYGMLPEFVRALGRHLRIDVPRDVMKELAAMLDGKKPE